MLKGNEGSFFGDELEDEIGMLLREPAGGGRRQGADDRERELNMYRSGSAPPTVEGSLSAIGGFSGGGREGSAFPEFNDGNGFASEEEMRSHPGYLSYYYSNVNLNPRLPPPLLSKEDWRFTQRLKGGSGLGGIGDRRKANGGGTDDGGDGSFFSMPPGFDSGRQESDADQLRSLTEWGGDGLIGFPGLGLRDKQKSFVEILQNDLGRTNPIPGPGKISRPASRNTLNEDVDAIGSAEAELTHLRHELASSDASGSGKTINGQGLSAVQNVVGSSAYTYAAAVGTSLSRSTTPDPKLVARAPSPCPTPIGGERSRRSEKRSMTSPNSFHGSCANTGDAANIGSAFSGLNLSSNGVVDNEYQLRTQIEQNVDGNQNCLFGLQGGKNHIQQHGYKKKSPSGHFDASSLSQSAKGSYSEAAMNNGGSSELNNSSLLHLKLVERQKSANPDTFSYLKRSPTSSGLPAQFQHVDSPTSSLSGFGLGGYSANPGMQTMTGNLGTGNIPPLYESATAASAYAVPGTDSRVFGGSALQSPFLDSVYLQYLKTSEYAAQVAGLNDPSVDGNYMGNSYMNLVELQKAYLGDLLSQKPHDISMGVKSGSSNYNSSFYGNPVYDMSYPGSSMLSPMIPNSSVGLGSPLRHNDLSMRFPSGMRNLASSVMGPWHLDAGYEMNESFPSTLLEQFKSNKTKCIELSEISGHAVEFSTDQFGSRFIQQKLETATADEKSMVYQEIMPHALALMTDVFGNYVVQKFFEHGLPPQRRELASMLFGHVLTLSLQMYGCRVIQKAIEVVDLDQKIRMVQELDGHIMRCVRDQNGNHVIQKCIECVPEENIQFIISTFFDEVLTLSTHPYGCRVIQRVLEHCKDPETQDKVMDEILGAVSRLAQDQYGNYVIQHVLEHGKPHERSAIIKELSGNIVQMSQQKFASNVVEKCLAFGGPTERQLLVNEMLGSTDENEPLQAMMKDQFANYVVQKVLETCDDQQREHILSRIKVHLNALKKYTYGKHIVARVEKLVAAGERRMAAQFQHTA